MSGLQQAERALVHAGQSILGLLSARPLHGGHASPALLLLPFLEMLLQLSPGDQASRVSYMEKAILRWVQDPPCEPFSG